MTLKEHISIRRWKRHLRGQVVLDNDLYPRSRQMYFMYFKRGRYYLKCDVCR